MKTSLLLPTLASALTLLLATPPVLATPSPLAEDLTSAASRPAGDGAARDLPQAAAIEPHQQELLDLAYATASAQPLHPHAKSRARAQEQVVGAALSLDQPATALRYIEGVENWRRGLGFAELAFHCAERGHLEAAGHFVEEARVVAAEVAADPDEQTWRVARIRARAAAALLLMGQQDEALTLARDLEPSEVGNLEATRARQDDPAIFDESVASIELLIGSENLDQIRTALLTAVQLFDTFHADPELRERARDLARNAYPELPPQVRFEVLAALARVALDHDDVDTARKTAEEMHGTLDRFSWAPGDHVAMLAHVAGIRGRAGDTERGRRDASAAQALFDRTRDRIVNFDQADALVPVAEAWADLDDHDRAHAGYLRAAEAAAVNPNARVRADDLTLVTTSMALSGVEPDDGLWQALRDLHDGLDAPW